MNQSYLMVKMYDALLLIAKHESERISIIYKTVKHHSLVIDGIKLRNGVDYTLIKMEVS